MESMLDSNVTHTLGKYHLNQGQRSTDIWLAKVTVGQKENFKKQRRREETPPPSLLFSLFDPKTAFHGLFTPAPARKFVWDSSSRAEGAKFHRAGHRPGFFCEDAA
jgi:hypothetical protein